jgi:energy-coupling factor transporter ATP-binding protein EcfA2
MIRIRDLSLWYGEQQALDRITLDVRQGECLLVTGPSGCGKSSLGRLLAGLIPHSIPARVEGCVEVDGRDVRQYSLAELARTTTLVFQNPGAQLFHLRVEDELAFGPRNLGLDESQVQERVAWVLQATGLEPLRDARPADLSGGQKQKLAIAAALAMEPRVLILDEPTASLDIPGTRQVVETLQELRRRLDLTLVIFEHRLAEIAHLCDRAVILDAGHIAADGPFEEVLENPENLSRFGLRRPSETAQLPWQQLLTPDGHLHQGLTPILEFSGVSSGYNRRAVLQDVSLQLFPGEFTALVGENGSGKTTLALTVAGLLHPQKGSLRFGGGRRPRPGLDIALLFQNPLDQLFNDNVEEEVAFAPRNHGRFDRSQHEQTLSRTDLVKLRDRAPLTLSAGQQQRTALAACLSLAPALLILDEPTLGQDWRHLEEMMNFLQQLNSRGTTILLITHDYKLVHRYARRVILLEKGRIALDGHIQEHSEETL